MLARVFTFADPDDYQSRIRASRAEILTSGTGRFEAGLTCIDFDRLWMQCGHDSLPRIARTALDERRAAVFFLARPQPHATLFNGHALRSGEMALFGRGTTNILRTEGANRWSSMSLDHESLALAGEALAGRPLECPSDTRMTEPPGALMARLSLLHAQAVEAARTMPDLLAIPTVARALEQELVHLLVSCLAHDRPVQHRAASRQHARMIVRFQEFLETRRGEPVHLAEICAAIGASERALRACCQEVLGVGPVRYLWLRRMHLVRLALLRADPVTATVTELATAQGFWELGRFAVEYRALFGESPSASLRRPGR